jgi:hypothetical protein
MWINVNDTLPPADTRLRVRSEQTNRVRFGIYEPTDEERPFKVIGFDDEAFELYQG